MILDTIARTELSTFNNATLDAEKHIYHVGDKEYRSVTTLIKKYRSEFNRPEISQRVAVKCGLTPEIICSQWEAKRGYAAARGTEFHAYIEAFICFHQKVKVVTPLEVQITQFHKFFEEYMTKYYDIVAIEQIIYDEAWDIAGTIDCIVREKYSGKYILLDWKSNEEIKRSNYFSKMLTPFDTFDDCDFSRYSLQLCLYRNILKRKTGLNIDDTAFLIHFPQHATYNIIETFNLDQYIPLIYPV